MRHIISSVVFLVAGLLFCSMTLAQEPTPNMSWDACLKAPKRDSILDEALVHALAVEPSQKTFDGTCPRDPAREDCPSASGCKQRPGRVAHCAIDSVRPGFARHRVAVDCRCAREARHGERGKGERSPKPVSLLMR